MAKVISKKKIRKPQKQSRPGLESKMFPKPVYDTGKAGTGKLAGKTALITGGDSGIGKAVAVLFAKEGADIAIVYLNEWKDADQTRTIIESYGRKCLLVPADVSFEKACISAVKKTLKQFKRIDVLVNNAAVHYERDSIEKIETWQLLKTFQTNLFSFFWITKSALKYIPQGGAIINTASVTAYRGSDHLLDYAATKGAIVSFTRSLSASLIEKKIRVNAVAPGPIWTPLIVSTLAPQDVAKFGSDVPMKRAGEPVEVAPCYLFLACSDSSYMTGQVLHPNGGEIING